MKIKIFFITTILMIVLTAGTTTPQSDSVKFGELETSKMGANYYNYSDKDKGNIEVIVWGGIRNPGVYLIPEGTTLVQLISLTGGATDETIYEDFKFIRTKDKNPNLKADSILVLNFKDFFDKEKKSNISKPNPTLLAGDILVFPIKPEKDFWETAARVTGVIVVPLLTLTNLILQIINLSK